MAAPRNHIKVFVASTIYNFQPELNKIYELLDGFGYDVHNSHKGTFLIDSSESNLQNCIESVNECDVFVGFIRPDYGSGVLERGGKSITHLEFETAVARKIPRFLMADYRVTFTRSLIRKATLDIPSLGVHFNVESSNINFNDNKIMDIRCVQLYEEMIKDKIPPLKRKGNWVQEYVNLDDIRLHLDSQFKYPERIKSLMDKISKL
ncbi:DUF4062 domain-containing protein [Algoriphagus pacificus]|uniref:DUF4062 domain-containing protein n=1 Tax=Algoriphagus pacificus TaxID=2811234 RepID=A0ABS3CGM1_9BACT|nr:DUF4062 domain-containing protein [Algoriphagus pacificus]MBN7816248.1 DUF4062 domain-containing protein [Algoriphagus pacificus]